jgi:hypothetical protein
MAKNANAKKAANEKRPHLSDLFKVGELVTVVDSDDNEYQIYVRRPSPTQLEEAREHANGKMGRYKRAARDESSDTRIALEESLEDQDRDELISSRAIFDGPEIRDIAFNEVLYDEDLGEDWETDDRYIGVLTAVTTRMGEIEKYNTEMKEADADDRIDEDEDAQLKELLVEYDLFQSQVLERSEVLLKAKIEERGDKTDEQLREDIINVTIDLESKMMWYEAYQVQMLYYACRYPDNKRSLYFTEPSEVLEIPQYIRSQLYDAYERLEAGSDDVKNSLSLPSSSA